MAVLVLLIAGPIVLSGCLGSATDFELPSDLKEDHGVVTIWVNRPIGLDDYPVRELVAAPRLVSFIAGDNETKTALGPGYTDVATGWPSNWALGEHERDQWPVTAEKDWTQRSGIWYQGQVPAGDYSVIRIEVMDTWMSFSSGARGSVDVQGGRLSFAPGEGEYFTVEDGEHTTLALDAKLEEQGYGRFVIR